PGSAKKEVIKAITAHFRHPKNRVFRVFFCVFGRSNHLLQPSVASIFLLSPETSPDRHINMHGSFGGYTELTNQHAYEKDILRADCVLAVVYGCCPGRGRQGQEAGEILR